MKNFRLNPAMLDRIKTATGLDAAIISTNDISAIDDAIVLHTGKKLTPSVNVGGLSPRGSIYLMFNRLFSAKYIDRILSQI